jgi:predicted branched-subunit amino acid permease
LWQVCDRTLLGAYALTDQAFGVTMVQYQKESNMSCTRFYLGAAAAMWIMYQLAAAAGIYLGGSFSENFSLDFAVPLTFSALVVPLLTKPEQRVTAGVAAMLALLLRDLPNSLGFFVATFSGISAGCTYKYFKAGETSHNE